MEKLTIITDNKPKHFKYGYEVPKKIMDDQFSHLDMKEDSDMFLKYRGYWYHISDFMNFNYAVDEGPFKSWHGIINDSFFSGLLIKVISSDSYIIGRYYC